MEAAITSQPDDSTETNALTDKNLISIGLHPIAAVALAIWYGITAAGAMGVGFHYLHPDTPGAYFLVTDMLGAVGFSLGILLAVLLTKTRPVGVGVASSFLAAGALVSLLLYPPIHDRAPSPILGFTPSIGQFLVGFATLVLTSGLVATFIGLAVRFEDTQLLNSVPNIHWWWLWLAMWVWVSVVPTGLYFIWLEVISTAFVVIHPSLWFSDALTEGWTWTFGILGLAALGFGIGLSLDSISAQTGSANAIWERALWFLLGTLVLSGLLASVLFRIAIHSLKHIPDGISTNPWWVVR
jgi:hypothetical protein